MYNFLLQSSLHEQQAAATQTEAAPAAADNTTAPHNGLSLPAVSPAQRPIGLQYAELSAATRRCSCYCTTICCTTVRTTISLTSQNYDGRHHVDIAQTGNPQNRSAPVGSYKCFKIPEVETCAAARRPDMEFLWAVCAAAHQLWLHHRQVKPSCLPEGQDVRVAAGIIPCCEAATTWNVLGPLLLD